MIRFTAIAFLLLANFTFGQQKFFKLYTDNGYDEGRSIVQLSDSGYLVTGSSSSFFDGPSQAFLLRIDSLGNRIWSRNYGGSEADGGQKVLLIPNEAVYVAGYTNSIGEGAYDYYLIKTNLNGDLIWEKSYGTSAWERVHDAALTQDSGVIMVGETTLTDDGFSDIYIVRTDKNGDTLWTKQIVNPGEDIATSIDTINSSTFVIGGQKFLSGSDVSRAFLMSIDEDGQENWAYTYGSEDFLRINDLTNAYGALTSAGMSIRSNGDTALFLLKTDYNGIELSFNLDGSSGVDYATCLTEYGSNGLFLIGLAFLNQYSLSDAVDMFFSKYDQGLNWQGGVTHFNNFGEDICFQLIPTNDGGVAGVGFPSFEGAGGRNVFVMKIGPNDDYATFTNSNVESLVELKNPGEVKFKVYPNPASDFIYVEGVIDGELQLMDLSGVIVSKTNESKLNTSFLANGIYLLNIFSNKMLVQTQKIVISR